MTTTTTTTRDTSRVRLLGPADQSALLKLATTSSTGSERFRVDRSPDYFALGKALGNTRYHGLFEGKDLIACLALSEQMRFAAGAMQSMAYVHDVRVRPERAGRGVLRLLAHTLKKTYGERFPWIFCTILDDNTHAAAVRATGSRFGPEHTLGHTVHVGVPVMRGSQVRGIEVREITKADALTHYLQLAQQSDMAPADTQRFLCEPGQHLAALDRGLVIAVTKVTSQRHARRIMSTQPRAWQETLLSSWFSLRGAAPLARQNEELRVAYLSHFAARTNEPELAQAFARFIARCAPGQLSYLFLGVAPAQASLHQGLGVVRLSSTTYAYGAVPESLRLDFRDLSWI